MPAAFFKPVGAAFIQDYNQLFQCQWGPEWGDYSLAYLIYISVVSMYNFSHPKFLHSAPAELQVLNYRYVCKDCLSESYSMWTF